MIGGLSEDAITVRLVRNVAPMKDMVCVSFQLNPDILLNRQDQSDDSLRDENGNIDVFLVLSKYCENNSSYTNCCGFSWVFLKSCNGIRKTKNLRSHKYA